MICCDEKSHRTRMKTRFNANIHCTNACSRIIVEFIALLSWLMRLELSLQLCWWLSCNVIIVVVILIVCLSSSTLSSMVLLSLLMLFS